MNKKLIIISVIYVLGLVSFSGYTVIKGETNYMSYRKHLKVSKDNVESKKELNKKNMNTAENKEQTTTQNVANKNTTIQSSNPQNTQPKDTQPSNTPKPNEVENHSAELDYSNVNFTKPLRKGASGEDVKKLQALLKKKGLYTGEITGYLGNDTEIAVKKFQNSIKVKEDGVLGVSTWTKLLE